VLRFRSLVRSIAKIAVVAAAISALVVGLAVGIMETAWGKNQLRALIVRQANQALAAKLEIGRLGGSLFGSLELGGVRLSRNGSPFVEIDAVDVSYSLRQIWQRGLVIREIRVIHPRIAVARDADGRWNLGSILKRSAQPAGQPMRTFLLERIDIVNGSVVLADPLQLGAAHVPRRYDGLNVTLSFGYTRGAWQARIARASWTAPSPELTVNALSGVVGHAPDGWLFENLLVETPATHFTLTGRVYQRAAPTTLDFDVRAGRFSFQEWSNVLPGLKNIAVDADFDTHLQGPLNALRTDLRLSGTGGAVAGMFVLDTTVPGWHGRGTVDIRRLDLARWLSRQDRPSNITGKVAFDLDFGFGLHLPRGTYSFAGPHAAFMGYQADDLRAQGAVTETHVIVQRAAGIAYGADVVASSGSIGLAEPFPFLFQGRITALDLRRIPPSIPVPRVVSALTFDYDVSGRFSQPYVRGSAHFDRSTFLGASVGAGTVGTIDTSTPPLTYSGTGDLEDVSIATFGEGLDVAWMKDARYAGTVSGRFDVRGAGTDGRTLTLAATGRVGRASLFGGRIFDADVGIEIDHGSLVSSFDGAFESIDPSIAFANPAVEASLSGSARVRVAVPDLLTDATQPTDYDVEGRATLKPSVVYGLPLNSAEVAGRLHDRIFEVGHLDIAGPALDGHATGTLALRDDQASSLDYNIARANLPDFRRFIGRDLAGLVTTKGRFTGTWTAARLEGTFGATQLAASGFDAASAAGSYDATIPSGRLADARFRIEGNATFLGALGQTLQSAAGMAALDGGRLGFDVAVVQREGRTGRLAGTAAPRVDRREVELIDLTVTLGTAPWTLERQGGPAVVSWDAEGINVSRASFVGGPAADQHVEISGNWRDDGRGALAVKATHVFLDTLTGAFEPPGRYGGILDLDATISGLRSAPIVTGRFTVADGRVQRLSYQKLAGQVGYADGLFDVDLRLDQSPGVWLTAAGRVPYALLNREWPERDLNVSLTSSSVGLGLLEGLTDQIRDVRGQLQLDVRVVGTSADPHFEGNVGISDASFLVTATGSKYKNGRADLELTRDRLAVKSFSLEDANGRSLEVRGSLGTHELTVGDFEIDVNAQRFEVMRNEFGRLNLNAALRVRGALKQPRLAGEITISAGDLRVDEILSQALFRPYAVTPELLAPAGTASPRPWDRLALDLTLHVPDTLKMVGQDVQVTPGTPIGLGDINLRVGGDLFLYKDPGQPLYVTGSFDAISGTYAFQGRRFDINEAASSINFRGDLDPEIWVTVTRLISGVTTSVTIAGPMHSPELRLASNPPLDAGDILSLIVFNTSASDLSAPQQQELAVRAGTLAASFLATPLISALQNELGLETLRVEAGGFGEGPRVTVGQELAPGLVARFSRQFGPESYDEATVEYYLSRILRLRGTFSDAASLTARSPFRRVERAGVDLMLFFSF
jgi:autotransporter translocation and assembly factor TamB